MAKRIFILAALVAFGLSRPLPSHAQTCASPIPLSQNFQVSGTSCGADTLPSLNHGAINTQGDDIVYHVIPGKYGANGARLSVPMDGASHPDAVFLCRAPCGINAECVDASSVSSGFAQVTFPSFEPGNGGDYYVIVDSTSGSCGDYSLMLSGPLSQP